MEKGWRDKNRLQERESLDGLQGRSNLEWVIKTENHWKGCRDGVT